MTTVPARIFHLVEVDAAPPEATDAGTGQLERHGFVHCCFREQLTEVATWWFAPGAELMALEIDPARLSGGLRVEPSPRRWYPHVYGPLDAAAVVARHAVPRTVDGRSELPAGLRRPPPAYRLGGRRGGDAADPVRWQAGALDGDPAWVADARQAVEDGRLVELVGPGGPHGPATVVAPATLSTAYESFVLLSDLVDEVVAYEGDGFFREAARR